MYLYFLPKARKTVRVFGTPPGTTRPTNTLVDPARDPTIVTLRGSNRDHRAVREQFVESHKAPRVTASAARYG